MCQSSVLTGHSISRDDQTENPLGDSSFCGLTSVRQVAMGTILMTWELGAGAGHCVNLQPIAEALLARGHRVCVAARDVVTARSVFTGLAIELFQAPFLIGVGPAPVARPGTFADILHNTGFGDDCSLAGLVAAWSSLFSAVDPAVTLFEHSPSALLTSRWFPTRRVIVGTGFFSPPNISPLPDLRDNPRERPPAAEIEPNVLGRINAELERRRRPALNSVAELYASVDENFFLTFAELDHYTQRPRARYFGMWSPIGGIRPEWPASDGSRIFAYSKPSWGRWNVHSLISTLRELRLPTLAYVPGVDPRMLESAQTPLARFFTERLDADYVAHTCQVAFHHGNAGTATHFLLAGVPQVMAPLALEQEVFSRRIAELGAGAMADPARPEQILMRLIRVASSPGKRQAAADFAARYAAHDPRQSLGEIVERIHQLAA
jgi:hypothetical protein